MKKTSYHIISLGCAKNTVDSSSMAQLLNQYGYSFEENLRRADFLIVNTCGFIEAARQESVEVLKGLAKRKRKHQLIIVSGCLSQRYGEQILQNVSGIDGILGTRNWNDIVRIIEHLRSTQRIGSEPLAAVMLSNAPIVMEAENTPRIAVQGKTAYIKIADGCRRSCAFCAIPSIKGSLVSRPMKRIIEDARLLQEQGIQEIILIAQDTTDYGSDLGIKDGLVQLLKALTVAIPSVPWIRILYTFPGYISEDLIELMAHHPQILPYLDIPLQHAHPAVLKRMGRPTNIDTVLRTFEKIRKQLPQVVLRTTFIVGYPDESEAEFNTLLDFIAEVRFDKIGVFPFSFERGTLCEHLGDPIPPEVKEARLEKLLALQQDISLQKHQSLIGKTLAVLIEGTGELEDSHEPLWVGRSYRDAPEIDGFVFIQGNLPKTEGLIPVRIEGALPYDLIGSAVAQLQSKQ